MPIATKWFIKLHMLYTLTRMPFELFNDLDMSHQSIDKILSSVKWWSFALVYLDYIIIFSRDTQAHILHAHSILSFLLGDVTMDLNKCNCSQIRLTILGNHTPSQMGGLWAYYRCSLASWYRGVVWLSRNCSMLHEIQSVVLSRNMSKWLYLSKTSSNRWTKDGHYSYEGGTKPALQENLLLVLVLTSAQNKGHLTIDTDACNNQIGFFLLDETKKERNRLSGIIRERSLQKRGPTTD